MLHCQCLHVTQIRLIFQFNNEVLSMILFRLFYIIGVCLCFKHRRNQRTGQSKLTLDLKFTYFLSNGKNKCQKWSNYKLYHETNGLWLRSTKSFADDSKQDLSCWEGLYVGLLRKNWLRVVCHQRIHNIFKLFIAKTHIDLLLGLSAGN